MSYVIIFITDLFDASTILNIFLRQTVEHTPFQNRRKVSHENCITFIRKHYYSQKLEKSARTLKAALSKQRRRYSSFPRNLKRNEMFTKLPGLTSSFTVHLELVGRGWRKERIPSRALYRE